MTLNLAIFHSKTVLRIHCSISPGKVPADIVGRSTTVDMCH